MGAEVIILFNPYTYNFLKGLTHSAVRMTELSCSVVAQCASPISVRSGPHWVDWPCLTTWVLC